MKTRVPSKVKGGGGSEYYPCALCQDEGEMSERAENIVLIKLRTGGEEEWTSVCARHARGVGNAESQYERIGRPVMGVPEEFVRAKRREELGSSGAKEQSSPYDARMTGKKRFLKAKPKDAPRQFRD